MKRLAIAAAIAACAPPAPGQTEPPARVEATYKLDAREPSGERYLQALKSHIERSAPKQLAPGQTLSVELLRVHRAGHRYWRGGNDSLRVVTDSSPARIELAFRLTNASQATLAEGLRSLRNPDYFAADRGGSGDPLRFEKTLLDDWLAREFAPRR